MKNFKLSYGRAGWGQGQSLWIGDLVGPSRGSFLDFRQSLGSVRNTLRGEKNTASTASTARTPPRPSPTSQLDRGATHLYLNPLPRQTAFHKEGSQEKDDSSLRTGSPWSQPTNGSFTIGPVGGASTNIQTHTVTVTPHTQRPAPVILDEDYDC